MASLEGTRGESDKQRLYIAGQGTLWQLVIYPKNHVKWILLVPRTESHEDTGSIPGKTKCCGCCVSAKHVSFGLSYQLSRWPHWNSTFWGWSLWEASVQDSFSCTTYLFNLLMRRCCDEVCRVHTQQNWQKCRVLVLFSHPGEASDRGTLPVHWGRHAHCVSAAGPMIKTEILLRISRMLRDSTPRILRCSAAQLLVQQLRSNCPCPLKAHLTL